MSKESHPFVSKQAEESKIHEYLGSDGYTIAETYNSYLKASDKFKAKARKYAKDNLLLKNSTLHHFKCGYDSSEKLEEEVLLEREKQLQFYKKDFHISSFDEDPNSMFECYTGKSKRIRIIRELNKVIESTFLSSVKKNEEFSNDFDKKKVSWFTRYCILSKFIQGARSIILLNRLQKALAILKTLTPEIIQKIENGMVKEKK